MNENLSSAESASVGTEDLETVPGERNIASVNRIRSVQSRVSSALAIMVFGGLALAGLVWYYSSALNRSHRPQAQAARKVQQQAEGEMTLPSLGLVSAPDSNADVASRLLGAAPPAPSFQGVAHDRPRTAVGARSSARTEKTSLERQLAGPVIVRATSDRSATHTSAGPPTEGGELSNYLHSTSTETVRARSSANQQLLLAKGTTLDCTLLSAIDSTLPGFTKCVIATDTWSADGSVVLLERGSQLFGETRGQVESGKNRLFIVWTEARTPEGTIVPLVSPGTDPLGRAGVTGQVDRHFWSRFGSAILVSVVDGVVQGVANSQNRSGVVINPSSSRDVATEILRETMRLRPTLRKNQGDRVAVLVARDVNFRGIHAFAAE